MVARSAPLAVVPPTSPVPSHVALAASLVAWLAAACTQYRGPGAASALRALILASVCPRPVNVLLLGPPGTAKTAMGSAVARALGGSFLGRTLSPWTTDAEILGPVDIAALAAGTLQRVVDPSRPSLLTADSVLLDEFPRASPGIRALVMSALADRVTPTGDVVPAHVIAAAANTRLTGEDEQATVDRFTLRVEVPRLLSAPDLRAVMFREVTVGTTPPTIAPLPSLPSHTVAALRAHAATVTFPDEVADAMVAFALALRQPAPTGASYPDVSERRWIVATRILQASATLRGASVVSWADLTDTLPLTYDDGPESRPAVAAALAASIPRWVRAVADVEAACTAAISRAYRVGSVVDVRKGDADGHALVGLEFDALIASVRPYGAAVLARATAVVDAARKATRAEYDRGLDAQEARNAASR